MEKANPVNPKKISDSLIKYFEENKLNLNFIDPKFRFLNDYDVIDEISDGKNWLVFHLRKEKEGFAIRFPVNSNIYDIESRVEIYNKFLKDNSELRKYLSAVNYTDKAIEINNDAIPAVLCKWIDGSSLLEYVRTLCQNGKVNDLKNLYNKWVETISELQNVKFAHGDISSKNVRIDQSFQRIKFIDFDSFFIPELKNSLGVQFQWALGTPGFIHPLYNKEKEKHNLETNEYMDNFSALVMYCSVFILSKRPDFLEKSGRYLLFSQKDLDFMDTSHLVLTLSLIQDKDIDWCLDLIRKNASSLECFKNPFIKLIEEEGTIPYVKSSRYVLSLNYMMSNLRDSGNIIWAIGILIAFIVCIIFTIFNYVM